MSRQVPVGPHMFATVDADDFERVSAYSWHVGGKPGGKPYARSRMSRKIGGKAMRMHRFIMNAPDGMEVDHINGDTMDNRRANLRVCTRAQNAANIRVPTNGVSGYRGVHKGRRAWDASIMVRRKRIRLGVWETREEAARAYNAAAATYFGEFAVMNSIPCPDCGGAS